MKRMSMNFGLDVRRNVYAAPPQQQQVRANPTQKPVGKGFNASMFQRINVNTAGGGGCGCGK
jgi:hypothetical protein